MMETDRDCDIDDRVNTHMNRCNSTISESERRSSDNKIPTDCNSESFSDDSPSKLKFVEETGNFSRKVKKIESALSKHEVKELRKLAVTQGGLVNDKLRKIVWPLLLGLETDNAFDLPNENQLKSHPQYEQVVMDVNRSVRRFPPDTPKEQQLVLQNKLKLLILQVISAHPKLYYYQGYHDVAITLLLVTGKETAYFMLEKLSTNHLKECMEPTMEKTAQMLNYIYPLVRHQNHDVYEHLEKSGVGTTFALPWFLTWFSHSLKNYKDIVRLYDYFLASDPILPLYLCAVLIVFRSKEILDTPCDIAYLHHLLSQIPDDLPFEELLVSATRLHQNYPPEHIEEEVKERIRREQEQRKLDLLLRRRRNKNPPLLRRVMGRLDLDRLPIWAVIDTKNIPFRLSYIGLSVATATIAGIAFYLKAAGTPRLDMS